MKDEAKNSYERQRTTEALKENMQNSFELEISKLRQQVQELTTEMEALQLQ